MDRHTCKLCFRRFHNGRALGGHMRSHVMAAAAAAHSLSPASTSSTEMAGTKRRRRRLDAGPESSGGRASSSSVVLPAQDGESDTESSPPRFAVVGLGRRRSKRVARRPGPPAPEQPAASGVSDAATPEEDVAMSLVMLSRDSWARGGGGGGRHRCGVCGKVFRSYQALGGHRASVKRGKGGCVPVPPSPKIAPPAVVHECPFCFRVFESGQALGGHKRAHTASQSPWAKCGGESSGSIDLNVPASTADDDFELSAVYDAEVGSARQ